MAPELFMEDGLHSYASDLWSLGIVFHEFFTGRPPFQPASFRELHNMILDKVLRCSVSCSEIRTWGDSLTVKVFTWLIYDC